MRGGSEGAGWEANAARLGGETRKRKRRAKTQVYPTMVPKVRFCKCTPGLGA